MKEFENAVFRCISPCPLIPTADLIRKNEMEAEQGQSMEINRKIRASLAPSATAPLEAFLENACCCGLNEWLEEPFGIEMVPDVGNVISSSNNNQ